MSGLVIVLTLPVNEEEGHLPYLSQSAYPAKGTTVGGRTDDPRRERTRNALARHRARAGDGQRQRGYAASCGSRGRSSIAGAHGWNAMGATASTPAGGVPR